MINPTRHEIEAVSFEPGRRQWRVIDPTIAADFDAMAGLDDSDFRVLSRDLDDCNWIVGFEAPDRPPIRYFLWERREKKASFLFSHRPELDGLELAEARPIKYRAPMQWSCMAV